MNRRDLFKVTTLAGSAALAQEGAVAQTPSPTSPAAASAWKPEVFDAHQNETVVALTDLIIPATDTPGAKAANVNRYIDLFLRDGRQEERERFLAGLSWLDGYALRKHNHPFVRCSGAEQTRILEALSTNKEPGLAPGNRFFFQVKMFTSRIYFNTEIGERELNKDGGKPSSWGDKKHSAFTAKPL